MRDAAGALVLLGAVACQTTSSLEPAKAENPPTQPETKAVEAPVDPGQLETVYFDLDRWELRPEARETLKTNAEKLKLSEGWTVLTIEGHCDERGSDEYNLALGARRAETVARYLKDLGVSPDRLRTVSFGEARPAAMGHDEGAWKRNRRSEFRVQERHASR
jgi:peptidoglycan-associated lipoprotein